MHWLSGIVLAYLLVGWVVVTLLHRTRTYERIFAKASDRAKQLFNQSFACRALNFGVELLFWPLCVLGMWTWAKQHHEPGPQDVDRDETDPTV